MKAMLNKTFCLTKTLSIILTLSLAISLFPSFKTCGIAFAVDFGEETNEVAGDSGVAAEGSESEASEYGYLEDQSYSIRQSDDGMYSFEERSIDENSEVNEVSLISSVSSNDEELPSKLDLRDRGLVSRTKNQMPYGTCWALGALAASEISLKNSLGDAKAGEVNDINFSGRHLGWFGWTPLSSDESTLEGTAKTQAGEGAFDAKYAEDPNSRRLSFGGSGLVAASLFMQGVGPVDVNEVPYCANDGTRSDLDWSVSDSLRNTSQVRLTKENQLAKRLDGSEDTINEIRKELNRGRGVEIGYNSSDSYLNYSTYAQYTNSTKSPDHMVCIVGYDDDYDVSNFKSGMQPEKNGAFLVKNSWSGTYGNEPDNGDYCMESGSCWGIDNEGFFWLSYYDTSITDITTFEFDTSTYTGANIDSSKEIVDQYDYLTPAAGMGAYWTGQTQNGNTPWYCSIFTASKSQSIHNIGTYYIIPGRTMSYKVYKLKKDATLPDDYEKDEASSLVASGTYTSDYEGYVSIPLDRPFNLDEGEKYTIMFAQNNKGTTYLIPYGAHNASLSNSIVNEGESFYSNYRDGEWCDWADFKVDIEDYLTWQHLDNPPVKAYATVIDSVEDTCCVYFNLNNGQNNKYSLVKKGEHIASPTDPEKTGYTLEGWYKNADLTERFDFDSEAITSDIDLFAKWVPNVYTINFDGNGADVGQSMTPQNVTYDTSANLTTNLFTRSGSKFVGWSTTPSGIGGQTFSDGQEISNLIDKGSITLYAKWDNAFNVEYVMNGHGEQVATEVIGVGQRPTIPNAPTERGYTFINWYADEALTEPFDFHKAITENCYAYAKWEANTYDIEYELFDGINAESNLDYYTFGVGVKSFSKPKKRGCVFRGWFTDPQYQNKIESIPSDSTEKYKLYAKWSDQCCVIEFKANGGTGDMEYQNFDVEVGDSIAAVEYSWEKHVFLGWNTEQDGTGRSYNDKEKASDLIAGTEIVLYAQWRPNRATICYYPNGSTSEKMPDQIINAGSGDRLSKNTYERAGYTFGGWSYLPDGNKNWSDEAVFGDWQLKEDGRVYELYAIWTPNTYTVKFDGNGSDGGEQLADLSMTYDTAKNLPTNTFTKSGYVFTGWSKTQNGEDGTLYGDGDEVTNLAESGTTTLYAQWRKTSETIETYNITYTLDGGTVSGNPFSYSNNDADFTLKNPTKTGYTFTGWTGSNGETPQTEVTVVSGTSEDLDFTANWRPNEYTIVYAGGAGTTGEMATQTVKYGEAFTLLPNTFDKVGWRFSTWRSSAGPAYSNCATISSTNPMTTVDGARITLTATWMANKYTVNFDINGATGTPPKSIEAKYDTGFNTPTSSGFENAGYALTGWKDTATNKVYGVDENIRNLTSENGGSVTLQAVWSSAQFKITYNLNGGTVAEVNPTSYGSDTDSFTLNNPTKQGYTFAGWTGSNGETPQTEVTVVSGSSGDLEFTANWTPATDTKYAIRHYKQNVDGGYSATPSETTYGTGTTEDLTDAKAQDYTGFTVQDFEQVKIKADGTSEVIIKYTRNSYTITYHLDEGVTNSESNPNTYLFGVGVASFGSATKSGYKFVGWYTDSDLQNAITAISTTDARNFDLYPKFEVESVDPDPTPDPDPDPDPDPTPDPTPGNITNVKVGEIKGNGTLKVNGEKIGNGADYNLEDVSSLTIGWIPAVSGTNISIIKTLKINGVDQKATSKIDKTKWQVTNSEYKRRMKETVKMTTFDAIKNSEQTVTYDLTSSLSSLSSTNTVNIEVEFQEVVPVYRLYNMITSEHLFTTDKAEYDGWVKKCESNKDVWIGEGIDWLAPKTYNASTTAKVYRLYNAALGAMGKSSHYYTSDENEIKNLTTKQGWKKETQFSGGYVFLSDKTSGATPIWTCYNEALNSAHHYTSNKTEWLGLAKHGWDLEKAKNGTTGVFAAVMSAKP